MKAGFISEAITAHVLIVIPDIANETADAPLNIAVGTDFITGTSHGPAEDTELPGLRPTGA